MTTKITNYLRQDKNALITNQPCILTIDMLNYTDADSMIQSDESIYVKSLLAKIEFEDKMFDLVLDYGMDIYIQSIVEKSKSKLILEYKKDQVIAETSTEASEIKGQIQFVERLLGGREILKDIPHLYKRLISVYSPPTTDMDSVHIEVLASQVLRNAKDLQKLARTEDPYQPALVNIKKVVFSSGFLQGLAFENVGEAIRSGLVADHIEDPSIIEKILTGTVVEPETKKGKK